MAKLAQELSITLELYSNENTKKAIEKYFKNAKLMVSITKHLFEDWEDILVLAKNIRQDDLFVLVSARKGATSYIGSLENLPTKLEKYFPSNSRIVVYPQQFEHDYTSEQYGDVSSEPLSKGIETMQKIGKGIENIFKKDEG